MPVATAGPHEWRISHYERGIGKGTCRCGAVRYFYDYPALEYIKRAEELNREEGTMVGTINVSELDPGAFGKTVSPIEAMRKAAAEHCQVCEFAYEHNDQKWCSHQGCPSRVPRINRIPYRSQMFIAQVPKATPSAKGNNGLPATPELPDFNNDWTPIVQIKWFDCYLRALEISAGRAAA